MHILVYLRVFGIDSDYICTFRLLLRAVHKEIYKKNAVISVFNGMVSFRGQFNLELPTHCSPLGA